MDNTETLNKQVMNQEECNIFLLKLTDALEKDWNTQKRGRRYSAGRFAENAHRAFPQLIKVSHLRVARDAAKKIAMGIKPPGMAPCSAISGLLGYLFHFEAQYDWANVRELIHTEGKQFAYILETKPRQTGFSEKMVAEIVKVGNKPTKDDTEYLKKLIDLLSEKNQELEIKRTQRFERELREHKEDLERLEKLVKKLSIQNEKEIQTLIESFKQTVRFFETL
jgi:hypothetical protein